MTDAPLSGKKCVLVGGAGAIGSECAVRFARLGAAVIVTWHSQSTAAETLVAGLPGQGHAAFPVDVEHSSTIETLAQEVRKTSGRTDILVNLAGVTQAIPHGDLEALSDELIDDIMRINFRGVIATIRAFRGMLEESGDGLIVNVSSIAGTNGIGSNVAYCAAKAALNVSGISLARALAPRIRLMTVAPGVVDTSFVPGRDAAFNEKAAASIPLRRLASAADVADAIVACATHLPYSTGSIITVDGGRAL